MIHINLTNETFEKVIHSGSGLVLVDFWAQWCMPCKAMAPIFARVAEDEFYKDKVVFAKADVDSCFVGAVKYNVTGIPTLILFKDGLPVERIVGLSSEDEIKEILNQYI